jgi:glycosyltransferase involved in cell wall biosynthesis
VNDSPRPIESPASARDISFSVVIPLYNKERHVERAIRSAISQNPPVDEVIVIDDGSTDGSADIVERLALDDPGIRLIRQQNSGVASARNRGIREARGTHIAFLDADDEWLPGYLAEIVQLIARYPKAGAFCSNYRIVERDGSSQSAHLAFVSRSRRSLIRNYFKAAFHGAPVWTSATVVPRKVLVEVGVFLDGAGRGEDLELWARIGARYDIAFFRGVSAVYHKDADNRSDLVNGRTRLGAGETQGGDRDAQPIPASSGGVQAAGVDRPPKPARWWALDRLERMAANEAFARPRRRWMREWVLWCDILAAHARFRAGVRPNGLAAALAKAFGTYAFFFSLVWMCKETMKYLILGKGRTMRDGGLA